MSWHWRPLLGPVWIEDARGRRTGKGEGASSEEPEAAPPGSENQVPGAAVEPASPEPTGEKVGAAGLPGTPAPVARKFEQLQAGLFCFKGTGRTVFGKEQKGTGQTELPHSTPGALPASITDYRRIAQTNNGIPVYTFK